MAVISGDKRVDIKKLSVLLSEQVRVATPEEVRETTGYSVGGVPPFPHFDGVMVFPDLSLTRFDHVWAAVGSPNFVFRINTNEMIRLIGRGPYDLAA